MTVSVTRLMSQYRSLPSSGKMHTSNCGCTLVLFPAFNQAFFKSASALPMVLAYNTGGVRLETFYNVTSIKIPFTKKIRFNNAYHASFMKNRRHFSYETVNYWRAKLRFSSKNNHCPRSQCGTCGNFFVTKIPSSISRSKGCLRR